MERRQFLSRGGVLLGVAGLSGCTEETLAEGEREPVPLDGVKQEEVDLPVEQRLEVAEAGIERATGEQFADLDEFEAHLTEEGVDIEKLSEGGEAGKPIVSLESVFEQTAEEGFMHHLGIVAGGYAALVAGGHENEKLKASLLTESREFGKYEIRRRWAEEYNGGELTAREYADEIAVTAESS